MNAFRPRTVAFMVGFFLFLGAGAGSAAPEKIPPDKVIHPLMGPVSNPEIIPESRKDPVYPEKWRKLHLAGRVVLQCVVEASGSVSEAQSLLTTLWVEANCGKEPGKRTGEKAGEPIAPREAYQDFETAALDALKRWKYRPGTQNGKPVAVFFTQIVEFSPCPEKPAPGRPPAR